MTVPFTFATSISPIPLSNLDANFAAVGNSSNVTYTPPFTGGVPESVSAKLSQTVSVQDFGILPGSSNAVTNCDNYAKLASYVNSISGNCQIIWPASQNAYEFSAYLNSNYNSTANSWRGAIELVDVKNCYHVGFGATVKFNMNPAWYRGNPNVASLDESVFQFRASAVQGGCDHVGVIGLNIQSTATLPSPAAPGLNDGSSFGIAYRGCTNTYTQNVTCYQWGTDGIYLGSAYSDAFGGYGHTLINPVCIANYRQGISIVGNSDGTITGGEIRDTYGSSFGHGIDWEPNGSNTQSNWTVIGIRTTNNQLGAFNFINTSNVKIINADVNEQAAAGAIYIDGSNVSGYNVQEIVFDGGSYVAAQAVLYITGGSGITNIRFVNGAYISSIGATLNNSACFRINPFGSSTGYIGDFYIQNCVINGNGGIYLKSGATGTARFYLQNTKWNLVNTAATPLSFTMTGTSAEIHMDSVEMTIDPSNTLTTYVVGADVRAGSINNCTLSGNASAILQWKDWYSGSTLIIGYNTFSTYSYYLGPVTAMNLKIAGSVQLATFSGDYGLPFRIVNGGRQRVIQYTASPANFIGQQAPQDGDITFNVANSASSTENEIFVYDKNLGWQLLASQPRIGTTSSRPSTTGIAASSLGMPYFDTTLSANGKPIWFNGSVWVDATGASV
jgi:hypothetical protein